MLCYLRCNEHHLISTAPQITPLSTQFIIDRGGILKLDIYMCWLVSLRPTAVPLNSGCGWGKLESSLSFAFHILKKYDTRKYNILFSLSPFDPTSTEICSANLGHETTFATLPPPPGHRCRRLCCLPCDFDCANESTVTPASGRFGKVWNIRKRYFNALH